MTIYCLICPYSMRYSYGIGVQLTYSILWIHSVETASGAGGAEVGANIITILLVIGDYS